MSDEQRGVHNDGTVFVVWDRQMSDAEDINLRWRYCRDSLMPHVIANGAELPRRDHFEVDYRPCSNGCHVFAWLIDTTNGVEYRIAEILTISLPPGVRPQLDEAAIDMAITHLVAATN